MNNKRLASIRAQKWYHILPIKSGHMIEIHEKVWEGNTARIWKFKWLVIKVNKPKHVDGTFTIRWKVAGHTIEKIYPLSFPHFEKVILLDVYKTRRAKLYYIRDKVGKDARFTSISTADERGIDLVAMARGEADEAKKAYDAIFAESAGDPDDLTKIEGIWPKINDLLHTAGITTFSALAWTDASAVKTILEEAEGNFATHDPTTRPDQAQMAADGKREELQTRQDELDGGKPAEAQEEQQQEEQTEEQQSE